MLFSAAFAFLALAVSTVSAETHTVTFDNRCNTGTPTLISNTGTVLSTGGAYTTNAALFGAIAYLQTGGCGFNGDHCTMVEITLRNPPSPGAGSSVDLTLIPP
ncbi:hypothetical protein FB45DRAFT_1029605 [Roridomyces roridus]|uniref:Glycopeptide n=1 Tax=Roridomyces roridus TaxID=1738132 RepID=A0AAD7FMH8_9AGAR|nr:hypothetical protein FB45DRAFT_1029605 [Roridomyces roridus]